MLCVFGLDNVSVNLIVLFVTKSSYDAFLVYCLTSILLYVVIRRVTNFRKVSPCSQVIATSGNNICLREHVYMKVNSNVTILSACPGPGHIAMQKDTKTLIFPNLFERPLILTFKEIMVR